MPTEWPFDIKDPEAIAYRRRHALRQSVWQLVSLSFKFLVLPFLVILGLWSYLNQRGTAGWCQQQVHPVYAEQGLQTQSPDIALKSDIDCSVQDCSSVEYRAKKILKENPLIDGHNDLMLIVRKLYRDYIEKGDFASKFEDGGLEYHTDIPRLQKGLSSGSFWVAWVTCPANGTDFSDETYDPVIKATLEQLDLFHRLKDKWPAYFTPTLDSASALRAFESGHFISPLSIEGLHQIGNSIPTLRTYYQLGVRYATLTWNCHNAYADAALVVDEESRTIAGSPYWGGLSARGRELVLEMNRLGMMVDISHVSADTMRDVLVGSSDDDDWHGSIAPPIFSHSSAYTICPHPRNVPDDVLDLVKRRNSLVMVNFNPDFISCAAEPDPDTGIPPMYPPNATLAQVVRHVRYIGERIGYAHVGIGSDFDGIAGVPAGLEDVGEFPSLVAALLEAGVADEDVVKVIGGNLLRVWQEVDRVAAELRARTPPLEDGVSDFNGTDPT